MPITIDNAYIETFERNVRQLAQQSDSRLRMCVTERAEQSEKHNWDRLAESAAVQKTAARVATPTGGDQAGGAGSTDQIEWTRRVSNAKTFHTGDIFEAEDPVQMLIDPQSAIAESLAMNMRRAIDDLIILEATALADDGAGGTVALPASQIIGDGTGEITLDFILEVGELFHANDVDPDLTKYWILGPKQWRKLMQLLEITSADFMGGMPLSTGVLPNTAGFTFIHSNRLNIPAADQIDNLVFTRKAVGMHVSQDIKVKVAERADLSFAWQVYAVWTMGAVRVEDEHIVKAHLADTIT